MNKKIISAFTIMTIIIIAGIIGVTIWLSGNKLSQQTNQAIDRSVKKNVTTNIAGTPSEDSKPSVELANFKTYQNKDYGFEFRYPQVWRKSEAGDFFLRDPEINVLQLKFEEIASATPVIDYVDDFIKQHACQNIDDPKTGDHIIDRINNGVYYVEYCSAGTEVYHYVTKLTNEIILDFSYQENFEDNWTEAEKIELLKQIISTLKTKK